MKERACLKPARSYDNEGWLPNRQHIASLASTAACELVIKALVSLRPPATIAFILELVLKRGRAERHLSACIEALPEKNEPHRRRRVAVSVKAKAGVRASSEA